MQIQHIYAAYFSPMHTTQSVVTNIVDSLAQYWPEATRITHDFTLPSGREKIFQAHPRELIVIGLPVYAGRLPNLLLPYLQQWQGNQALAIPVVLYGNRSYGNSLLELHDLLKKNGFIPIAAAAFVGQHAFSKKLATGRPNSQDLSLTKKLAAEIYQRVIAFNETSFPSLKIPGEGSPDYGGYYQPIGIDGTPTLFLKAKPETMNHCIHCLKCVEVCPMGAIDFQNPHHISGTCIKCNACIFHCPVNAKQFLNPAYLSHVKYLEKHFQHHHPMIEWF